MRWLCVILVVSLGLPSVAWADAPKARARTLYARGKALYEKGDYTGALDYFERAYRLSHAPALLFNMAQAHRLAGPDHCAQALDLYEEYLAADPGASNHDEARERVGEMRECTLRVREKEEPVRSESEGAPVSRAPELAPAERRKAAPRAQKLRVRAVRHRGAPTAAILLTGVGATLGVAGTILYARARAKYSEAESACPCPAGTYSSWKTWTNVSYGLLAAGAASSATGLYVWFSSPSDARGFVIGTSAHF